MVKHKLNTVFCLYPMERAYWI